MRIVRVYPSGPDGLSRPALARGLRERVQAEADAFRVWVGLRRKPSYASKVASFLARLFREIGTTDPTEDQVAAWFQAFRAGEGRAHPPKNGTVRLVGAYIKLYSRFRVSQGRSDGVANFVDDVLGQYRDDDSQRDEPLTPEERRAVVDAAVRAGDAGFTLYLRLLYELGARADSVLALRWQDLHPGTRTVSLANEKQGYNRTGWISRSLMEDLLACKMHRQEADDRYVFPAPGQHHETMGLSQLPMRYWTAARKLRLYAEQAGIHRKMHLHLLKASRITDLFAARATPAEVSKLTRTSLQTLMRYSRPTNDQVLSSFDRYSRRFI